MMTFLQYLKALDAIYAGVGRRLALSPPASNETLVALEADIGVTVPSNLRRAWEMADGGPTHAPVFARPGYLTGYDFLSAAVARAERDGLRARASQYDGYVEADPRDSRIQTGWFQPGWLPFAGFGEGTLLMMIDLNPTEEGTTGQIVAFTHDPDEISFVAPSFSQFLASSLAVMAAEAEEMLLA